MSDPSAAVDAPAAAPAPAAPKMCAWCHVKVVTRWNKHGHASICCGPVCAKTRKAALKHGKRPAEKPTRGKRLRAKEAVGEEEPKKEAAETKKSSTGLSPLTEMTDREVGFELEELLQGMTLRARRFVMELGSGKGVTESTKAAGLSEQSVGSRLKERPDCARALMLMGEMARRTSKLTLEGAVEKFTSLSEEARKAGDFSASARSLREASLLLGLYPSEKVDITHRVNLSEVTPEEWEALALLRHGVRNPQLPASSAVVDAEVVHLLPAAEA
jgi:hypothetical protein